MRYWINCEDEDYEREVERVIRFGGRLPKPLPVADNSLLALFIGIQVFIFTALLIALVSSFLCRPL